MLAGIYSLLATRGTKTRSKGFNPQYRYEPGDFKGVSTSPPCSCQDARQHVSRNASKGHIRGPGTRKWYTVKRAGRGFGRTFQASLYRDSITRPSLSRQVAQ